MENNLHSKILEYACDINKNRRKIMTNTKDVIIELKRVREEKQLSYSDIIKMMEDNGDIPVFYGDENVAETVTGIYPSQPGIPRVRGGGGG